MNDEPLKSAYELAMEKLKSQDRARGVDAERSVSEDQKARIAEIRSQTKAKLAELEILWQARRAGLLHDHDALAKAEAEYVAERTRAEERAEVKIEAIRREA